MALKKFHELWTLSIFILLILSEYYVKAKDGCEYGGNLETDHSYVEERAKREGGLYILTDDVSCVGRVTLLEICGAFPEGVAHLFTAVYRKTMLNGTNYFKRVTDPEHVDINRRSVTICVQQSVDMRVEIGDTIGFSFEDMCRIEPLRSRFSRVDDVLVCPVYAALDTNNTEDKVYFSDQVNTTSVMIAEEDLSLLSGVKINIKGEIESFPPLFSEVCIDSTMTTKISEQHSGIITNPTEAQLFTGGGTYIMTETAECNGIVKSVSFCGFLNSEGYSGSQDTVNYYVYWIHFRRSNDTFAIVNQEYFSYNEEIISANQSDQSLSANLRCGSDNLPWEVLKGDQFGVAIASNCYNEYCPFQIGLINTGCEDTSLFHPDSITYYTNSPISMNDTTLVAVKINAQFTYHQSCGATDNVSHLAVIYGAIAMSLAIIAILAILVVVLMVQLKRSKPHVFNSVSRHVRQGSTRIRHALRDSLRRRNEVSSTTLNMSQSFRNRTFSEQNEYSTQVSRAMNNAPSTRTNDRSFLFIHHQATVLSGSYAMPVDDISRRRLNTDEPLYSDPPCEEIELQNELKKLEILRKNITLKEYLGSGMFGVVYHGLLQLTEDGSEAGVKEVAVKTMESGASEEQRIRFLQEAAIMAQFNNPYIVKIYGVLAFSQPYMILCELMNKGDLRCYLHTLKLSDTQSSEPLGEMCLGFTRQVANAMEYLSGKGFVHRDLAARNILVSMDGICKVADFGLSRDLQDEDYYIAHGGLVPVRWTAPEALKYRKYSIASDVWSFGIVLYEIWSLACKPYNTLTNDQVIHEVFDGQRLCSPPGCPRAIYNIMISCWHPETIHRPLFRQLHTSLQQPDSVLLAWSEEDMTLYSENARTIGATYQKGECLYCDLQKKYCLT